MDENKTSMYIVAIVGIVAAVAILLLLMNANIGSSGDISGQATSAMKISKKSTTGMEAENKDEIKGPHTSGMEAENKDE